MPIRCSNSRIDRFRRRATQTRSVKGMETELKTIIGLRWWIIALVCLGTIVNYLSRNALGVMAPELKTLLHMNTQQYSYVVGAFQIGYTIMQPVCGLVIDLIGLRLGFALFACLWSATGMLHGLA